MKSILCGAFARYGAARRAGKRVAGVVFAAFAALSLAAPALAQEIRLAALGDSLTAGYGLAPDDGLVPQLERWLRARGHAVSVMNAGVSGDTTTGGRARIDWLLADAPDVMIVALGGNDLLRGIDPALSRANLDAILTRLGEAGVPALLVGLPAPGNYGPAYQAEFAAIFPELAEAHGVLLLPDLLAPISARFADGTPPEALMQPDMTHPNAAGVALEVAALGPLVEALVARARP